MDYSKLQNLMKLKKMSYGELAPMIGMSKNGLNQSVIKQSLTISSLEKLAKIFEVPITFFFYDADINPVENKCLSCIEKERLINQLQDQLRDKERIIQVLEGRTGQQRAS